MRVKQRSILDIHARACQQVAPLHEEIFGGMPSSVAAALQHHAQHSSGYSPINWYHHAAELTKIDWLDWTPLGMDVIQSDDLKQLVAMYAERLAEGAS